jgi:hypothetical protein
VGDALLPDGGHAGVEDIRRSGDAGSRSSNDGENVEEHREGYVRGEDGLGMSRRGDCGS